jgi:hypothetical protein
MPVCAMIVAMVMRVVVMRLTTIVTMIVAIVAIVAMIVSVTRRDLVFVFHRVRIPLMLG